MITQKNLRVSVDSLTLRKRERKKKNNKEKSKNPRELKSSELSAWQEHLKNNSDDVRQQLQWENRQLLQLSAKQSNLERKQ